MKIDLLKNYPEKLRNSFQDALNVNMLELCSFELMDDEFISFVVPFLNTNSNIKSLNIGDNYIDAESASSLALNNTLTTLDVSNNQISAIGAKALAQNHKLATLNVSYNQIGKGGKEALQMALELTQKAYEQQKVAFAMGIHPRLDEASPILIFSKHCDKNLMREIFSYVKPRPFTFKI